MADQRRGMPWPRKSEKKVTHLAVYNYHDRYECISIIVTSILTIQYNVPAMCPIAVALKSV